MSEKCELSNEELIKKVHTWVDELCRTGGKGWSLQVPVNMDRDPDILISELCQRFENLQPRKTEERERGRDVSRCDWPGCNNESLCSSGNVGGAFVCRKHFEITNGTPTKELTNEEREMMTLITDKAEARRMMEGQKSSEGMLQQVESPGEENGPRGEGFAERCGEIAPVPNCLLEANAIINGERQDMYGSPEDSFEIISGYWNVFLREKIKQACNKRGMDKVDIPDLLTHLDATNMLVLFKQARKLGQKPCRDNYVDACGYEGIGADRLLKEQPLTIVTFNNTNDKFQATLEKAATILEDLQCKKQ